MTSSGDNGRSILRKWGPKLMVFAFICLICIAGFTLYSNHRIETLAKSYVTSDISRIPVMKAGLLLGTSRLLANGTENDFFYNRIDAAVELYQNKKIHYILVSGDHGRIGYNEPQDMKEELVKRGIPGGAIVLDYAGFRTLDSVVRAREIFGQNSIIVISQQFHNERAVYLARTNGIEAYGYNAKDVSKYLGFRTHARELFARDKVFIDLLFGVTPKYLGEKINLD
jgi:SanA protein